MTSVGSAIRRLLRIVAGMIVWASALVFLYAGQSLACQHIGTASDAGLVNPVTTLLLTLVVLHLAVLGALLWRWFRRPTPPTDAPGTRVELFCHRLEGLVLALSIAAVLWLASPVLMVVPCSA